MQIQKIIFTIGLVLISFSSFSQVTYLKTVEETQAISLKASQLFQEKKVETCLDLLKPYWPLPKNEIENLQSQTLQAINIVESRFGKAIDNRKVKNEVISDFSIRETYIIRYQYSAIRLIFNYYKSDKGWIINAFKWDDVFSEEFTVK